MQRSRRVNTPLRASPSEPVDEIDTGMDDDSHDKYLHSPTSTRKSLLLSVGVTTPKPATTTTPPHQRLWPIVFGAVTVIIAWLLIVGDTLFGASRTTNNRSSIEPQNMEQVKSSNNDGAFSSAIGPDGVEYHMIFSTGCSTFQDWQSYVFFYHAWKSGQPGHVTRIASGCSEQGASDLQKIFREQIDIMSPGRFHIHTTPDYTFFKPGVEYKYFNKPFGVKHWMEHVLGYPNNKQHDDAIIILMDPDQIVLRPFLKDLSNATELWNPVNLGKVKVEHGSPFAQEYGFGEQWRTKTNMSYVLPNQRSPVDDVSLKDAEVYYAAGPPYMATGRDMYAIVDKWVEFVPRVHDLYPHLLAEMFAYCVAAAHLKLPHQMSWSFMVSDTSGGIGEGWGLIDRYSKEQVCDQIPKSNFPHVIHYCQRYNLGKWYFAKHRLPDNFISCESNLLLEPPHDVAVQYDFGIRPWHELEIWRFPHVPKRHGFVLCTLIPAMNDAAIFYKEHNCPDGKANMTKSFTFFNEPMTVEQHWLDKAKEEFQRRPKIPEK